MSDNINVDNPNVAENQTWDYTPKEDGTVNIPVRIVSRDTASQPEGTEKARILEGDDSEAVVREYERRYGNRQEAANVYAEGGYQEKRKNDQSIWDSMVGTVRRRSKSFKMPPRHRYPMKPASADVSDDDRLWAAIAHGSALLTFIVLVTTGGIGVFLSVLVPMAIYFAFRNRSEYVAFHALQAFTIQVVGTIGALLLAVVGTVILIPLIVIAAIFSLLLIGIPFLLLFIAMLLMVWIGAFALIIGMLLYGMIAAFAAWNGKNYRYPYIADWVDDQLTNGILRPIA